jgi:hypothetical protein
MKDWIQDNYLDNKLSYKILRQAVMEAWEAVGKRKFKNLLASIIKKCQVVIAANSLYTKF